MVPRTADFGVVGAGPAGSRAAELLAARGASVLLFDPKAPWEKPCGGGLTAAALAHTPELQELDPVSQRITELRVVAPSGASVIVPLRQPYRVVSRLALAQWGLARARTAGARFVPRRIHHLERRGRLWRLVDMDAQRYDVRWLLGADGAASQMRAHLAPGLHPELAPTRIAYPTAGSPPQTAVFAFLPGTEGYLWDFPRRDHHSVGVGVPPRTVGRAALDAVIAQYRLAEAGDDTPVPQGGAVIATSLWRSGTFADLGAESWALLGDAGGLANPATGEGIDYALRSARLAVEAFDPDNGFQTYPARAASAFAGEMWQGRFMRRWLYRMGITDWLVRAAVRSPRAKLALAALGDVVNEHGALREVLSRVVSPRELTATGPVPACDCPPPSGTLHPSFMHSERCAV